MAISINHLHIHSKDIAASVGFYQKHLGMTKTVSFGPDLVFLSDGNGFDFAIMSDPQAAPVPAWFHFGVRVESREQLESTYEKFLAADVPVVRTLEYHEQDDYSEFRVSDPDGFTIEFYYDETLARAARGCPE